MHHTLNPENKYKKIAKFTDNKGKVICIFTWSIDKLK